MAGADTVNHQSAQSSLPLKDEGPAQSINQFCMNSSINQSINQSAQSSLPLKDVRPAQSINQFVFNQSINP